MIFDYKAGPILAALFVILFIAESMRQLRKRRQLRSKRIITNSLVAIPSFAMLRFIFLPAMVWLATQNEQTEFGIAYWYNAPSYIKLIVSFLILDYTNYLWHVINHKIPLLWRFHVVHHSDHDLDISTAFRFHFGELVGSVFYRGAFVLLSGVSPFNVLLYELIFEAATQFHHSNMRLPYVLEKVLCKVIVTPRMHGIHHSVVKNETDSNYSVIFSFWDRLHNTIRLNVKQDAVTIGVPAYPNEKEMNPIFLLKLPFTKPRQTEDFVDDNPLRFTGNDRGKLAE